MKGIGSTVDSEVQCVFAMMKLELIGVVISAVGKGSGELGCTKIVYTVCS